MRPGVALAALALAACVRAPPPELAADPADLLARVKLAQARVQRVRGRARVHISSPRASGTVTEFLVAEKPDRLRLETYDFFGNLAAVLVGDGKRFAFYDARERTYYRGEPTPENVSRLLPVVLPADELATILCGSAPILPGEAVAVAPHGSEVLLTVAAGAVGQRLTIGAELSIEESRVRQIVATAAGERQVSPAYDLSFDIFRHRGGYRFPTEATLEAPAAKVKIGLQWKDDLEVNPPEDAEIFRFEPPRGARIVDLEAGSPVPEFRLPDAPPKE